MKAKFIIRMIHVRSDSQAVQEHQEIYHSNKKVTMLNKYHFSMESSASLEEEISNKNKVIEVLGAYLQIQG